MNFDDLAKNVEMEKQEFLEMIELFLETSTTDLTSLHSALAKEEGLKAVRAAHSIKGAAANLGLTEIYELAKKIETEALANPVSRTSERILMLREKLGQMTEEFKRELKTQGGR